MATSIMVTTTNLRVTSVKELIALAKPRFCKLSFTFSRVGTMLHLGGELLKERVWLGDDL